MSKESNDKTAMKQDAFINVNTFMGGLLWFGLTGRKSSEIVPIRTVLELQLLSFFIFLGAIMSSLMSMLFVKFYNWKKYKPYQDALIKIKKRAELIWWTMNTNTQDADQDDYNVDDHNFSSHHDGLLSLTPRKKIILKIWQCIHHKACQVTCKV